MAHEELASPRAKPLKARVTSGWKREALEAAEKHNRRRWKRLGVEWVSSTVMADGRALALPWDMHKALGLLEGSIEASVETMKFLREKGVVGASVLFALGAMRDPEVFVAMQALHRSAGAAAVGEALRGLAQRRRHKERALVFPELATLGFMSIGGIEVGPVHVTITQWKGE